MPLCESLLGVVVGQSCEWLLHACTWAGCHTVCCLQMIGQAFDNVEARRLGRPPPHTELTPQTSMPGPSPQTATPGAIPVAAASPQPAQPSPEPVTDAPMEAPRDDRVTSGSGGLAADIQGNPMDSQGVPEETRASSACFPTTTPQHPVTSPAGNGKPKAAEPVAVAKSLSEAIRANSAGVPTTATTPPTPRHVTSQRSRQRQGENC